MHPLKGSTRLTPDRAQKGPIFIHLYWPCGHFIECQRSQDAALFSFGPLHFSTCSRDAGEGPKRKKICDSQKKRKEKVTLTT